MSFVTQPPLLPSLAMSVADPAVALQHSSNAVELSSRLSLFEKLSRVQDDVLAGKIPNLNVPAEVVRAFARAAQNIPNEEALSSRPGASSADAPASALPGLSTHPFAANTPLNPQPETQPPSDDSAALPQDDELEEGEVDQMDTSVYDAVTAQKSDVLAEPVEGCLGRGNPVRGPTFRRDGKELQFSDPRDLPCVDLAPIIAQAQALVPPMSGLLPTRTKSFSTESLYSSRGTWSANGSPQQANVAAEVGAVLDLANASAAMEISSNEDISVEERVAGASQPAKMAGIDYSPLDKRNGYGGFPATPPYAAAAIPSVHPQQHMGGREPEAVEILSDDDEIPDLVQPPTARAAYGAVNVVNDESTSSRSELQPAEDDDYDPESDDEYEPPGVGAFDTGGRRMARPLPPFKPYPGAGRPQQQKGRNKGNKPQIAPGNRPALPQQQRGKQPTKKRRRLDYPADPRKRVQQQFAQESPSSQYYTEPSSSESIIKREPISPPPLLPPESIPLPETPPTVSRRLSGYGSDVNGYVSQDNSYGRVAKMPRGKAPADVVASRPRTRNVPAEMSSALVPYKPRPEDGEPQVAARRTEESALDLLKIVAIGRNTGKFFYNRPIRPGDVIPQPDATAPYIDDPTDNAPTALPAQARAVSAYPEPQRTASYYDRPYGEQPPPTTRPERRIVSHGSAARAYSAYPEAGPPRAYSPYAEESPYTREGYGRPGAPPRAYEYPSARPYSVRPDPAPRPRPEAEPAYARPYPPRPEYAMPPPAEPAGLRAYSTRPDYGAPAPDHGSYEHEYTTRAYSHRPEPPSMSAPSEHELAADYWARQAVPQRAYEDTYPPRSHAAATFERSQSVQPGYSQPAPLYNQSSPYSPHTSKALMPPPPVPGYTREYHQPRHASAAPWQ